MDTRTLGSLTVSQVGLGCNNFGRKIDFETSATVVDAALACGINFFDTADRYGHGNLPFSGLGRSEEFLGRALGSRRKDVIVATKFGNPMGDDPRDRGGNRRWVRLACEASLRRLDTDYIDLYQIHRPDPHTPIEETLAALSELVDAGKVREIGCSNFTGPQIDAAVKASRETGHRGFTCVQNEYSLLWREPEDNALPACVEHGLAFVPYFPLASGLLTGKYRRGQTPTDSRLASWTAPRPHFDLGVVDFEMIEALNEFARDRGHSLLELALSWLAGRPAVASVIAGATRPDQVHTNARSAGWSLSEADFAALDELSGQTRSQPRP